MIAAGQTAVCDGDYEPWDKYPLGCMGVRQLRGRREDMVSAMLRVRDEDLALLPSCRDARLLYFGDSFLFADYEDRARGYLRLIPPHPYGPPERCYYREVTEEAGVHIHPFGRGRGILIPWEPGKLYYRDGYANTFRFMRDLLLNGAGLSSVEDAPFTPMVGVTAGESGDGSRLLIQLVNASGHFGTSYLPPLPVYGIALRIPCTSKPLSVRSPTSGRDIPFSWADGMLRLRVDVEGFFEGVVARI